MKRMLALILSLMFIFTACSNTQQSDFDLIKQTITSFYTTQYDAYLDMEYKDIAPYLDMTQIQNQNKVIALKELVARRKYADEMGYGYVEKERFPYTLNYKTIEINNNTANVLLNLEIEQSNAYPMFICSGDNVFQLKKEQEKWVIVNHDYGSLKQFELSKDEKLPEFNLEETKRQVDSNFK